jgi:holo-[acyl-carrier protein] synthase
MQYVGVDIIEISRIAEAVDQWGERFLRRVYTEAELALCRRQTPSLAARFAAKEAVVKALGQTDRGIGWRDIEVLAEPGGRPEVELHGRAAEVAAELGVTGLAISLSHSRDNAVAFVVGETG